MKKFKIVFLIFLIFLIIIIAFASCKKKVSAREWEFYAVGQESSSFPLKGSKNMLFNLPTIYITPGTWYLFRTSNNLPSYPTYGSTSHDFHIYIGEGLLNIYDRFATSINSYDYLTALSQNKIKYRYIDNSITITATPSNLMVMITQARKRDNQNATLESAFKISIVSYYADANMFLQCYDVTTNQDLTWDITWTTSYTYLIVSAYNSYASGEQATNINDYLLGFSVDNSTLYPLDSVSNELAYLNDNRYLVAFYQWGVRAIGGPLYDEGYSQGQADAYEDIEAIYRPIWTQEGYDEGYADGEEAGMNYNGFAPAFNTIAGVFEVVSAVLSIELVPHIPIGLFVLVPLFFSVIGLVLWIWRRN